MNDFYSAVITVHRTRIDGRFEAVRNNSCLWRKVRIDLNIFEWNGVELNGLECNLLIIINVGGTALNNGLGFLKGLSLSLSHQCIQRIYAPFCG